MTFVEIIFQIINLFDLILFTDFAEAQQNIFYISTE